MDNNSRIAKLIFGHLREELSKEEELELDNWVEASEDNRQLFDQLTDKANLLDALRNYDREKVVRKIVDEKPLVPGRVVQFRNRPFLKAAVAAAIILVIGAVTWMEWGSSKKKENTDQVKANTNNDRLPGGDKAILKLADGSAITLDDASEGAITSQGSVKISKSANGQITYVQEQTKNTEIIYNEISTPKGGQYNVVLSDGTKAWINAASSLRYPVNFSGDSREIELSGEVYFEVAKNPKMPFIVKVNEEEIKVLGTHFNVMAYADENSHKITLFEGSVKVSRKDESVTLFPGQQLQLHKSGEMKLIKEANLSEAIAWKNGIISFHSAELPVIMRQISRWYDIDVTYQGKIPELPGLNGEIPRTVKLSELLKALELNTQLHFKIENDKIIVSR